MAGSRRGARPLVTCQGRLWCHCAAHDQWEAFRHDTSLLGALPQVHSTLAAGLLPADGIASVDDVYAWLHSLLEAVWRDPVCGDGVCESPFEYAQYGEHSPDRWVAGT